MPMAQAMSDNAGPTDLPFACRCGMVQGRIEQADPAQGDFIVCHCEDCQAFAKRFDAIDRLTGEDAGTLLFQSRCARVKLDAGRDHLASLHLTEKPTLRWHASCCDTPMFNTFKNGKLPYITTLVGNCDERQRKTLLGEPIGHLFVKDDPSASSDLPNMSMNRLMRRFFRRMVKDIFSGDRRRTALFDTKTLEPIAPPTRVHSVETANVG